MENELQEFMKNMELEMIKSQSLTHRLEDEKDILCRELDKKDMEIAELQNLKDQEIEKHKTEIEAKVKEIERLSKLVNHKAK